MLASVDDALWDEVELSDECIDSFFNEQRDGSTSAGPPHAHKLAVPASEITLSAEQSAVLGLVQSRRNIFFTGSAGMYSLTNVTATAVLNVAKGLGSPSSYEQSLNITATNIVMILKTTTTRRR